MKPNRTNDQETRKTLIGTEFVRKLPKRNVEIRDTRIPGFVVRCRATGSHSYRLQLGRGQWATLGRVGAMSAPEARAAAEKMRGELGNAALVAMGDDSALTLAEAKAQALATIRARRGTRSIRTFGAFLDGVYEPWAKAHLRRPDEAVQRLKLHFGQFTALPLSQITGFQIEKWRTERKKAGKSASTINRDLAALRGALSRAVAERLVREHPMRGLKVLPTDKRPLVRFLSADEERRLRKALEKRDETRRLARDEANMWRRERGYAERPALGVHSDHLSPLVLLAMNTGLRRGELFSLRWSDVDFVARLLTVRGSGTKTGNSRVVPLNREAMESLNAWKPEDAGPDALTFGTADGGPMTTIKTAFLALLRAAKIQRFRFHDLRHHFASRLVQNGVDLNTVRELLGHADLKMTLRYAHLAPEHRAAAVEKLAASR